MDVTIMTLDQLKSLGFDQIQLLNQTQQNLNVIYTEIEKRKNQPEKVEA